MVDMSVKIGNVALKNPIMPASGAFSTEIAQVMDINRLGALVTKTVSRDHRIGNPPPRTNLPKAQRGSRQLSPVATRRWLAI